MKKKSPLALGIVALLVVLSLLFGDNAPEAPGADAPPSSEVVHAVPVDAPPSSEVAHADPVPAARVEPDSGLPWIERATLPPEAQATLEDIATGGPYDFDRDGITFQNREGILPDRARGHYREFTVRTPGVRSRGARRIVTGRDGEQYYTDDHYDSFRRITP